MISRSFLERRRYSCGRGIGRRIYKARPPDPTCGLHNGAFVRVLIFHGYLLRGTGSNVYNASLVAALAKLGHEVHLLCQDRHAAELPFVDAVGRWEGCQLEVQTIREPVRVTAYLPDIGRTLSEEEPMTSRIATTLLAGTKVPPANANAIASAQMPMPTDDGM